MTVARWQRWAVGWQLLLCALVLGWGLHQGWRAGLLSLGLLLIWLRLPLTVQFALALRACRGVPPHERPSWANWWAAWWAEGGWALRVFGWWQPFRADVVPGGLRSQAGARGVLLVHGFGCNRGFWTPWLRRLQAQKRTFIAVNLEPALSSIDGYVASIDTAVRTLEQLTGRPPLVVAHSMGGLAVRAWMRAVPGADTRVLRVVTLATPHQGTQAARWALGVNGRQMRPGSGWLQMLAASEPPARRALFECWQTECDNVVYPMGVALLPGAAHHSLPALGHVQLAFDARVMRACWAWLEGGSGFV